MSDMKDTHDAVVQWARDRHFFHSDGATVAGQMKKLAEEFCELSDAIANHDQEKIIDGIGDMTVVLTYLAQLHRVSLPLCYESAYQTIKDRKGKMVNGIFIKEQ